MYDKWSFLRPVEANKLPGYIPQFIKRVFYYLSRGVPLWTRMRFYSLLWQFGERIYGPSNVPWVQRLPFGLMMKKCTNSAQNEPNALRLVAKYTDVPAPRLVDAGEYKGETYLIMTHLAGQHLHDVQHLMSYAERDQFANDLAKCISQLRTIPNRTGYLMADTIGGPVFDHRIPDTKAGPFNNEVDFNNHLTSHLHCTPDEVLKEHGLAMREDHHFVFTHADMSHLNLLVENGRLSGIIDWECAGYWPEYWECVKAKAHARQAPVSEPIFNRVFGLMYAKEWEIYLKLWRVAHFGV